ncbi:aminotransferase class I/II-fold pyridoxal phosphate-dependent enzyme [Lichenifustis flavocetrariae]|uniref:Aminotransferase class I/II-fold pyridoxal phosphate-dependent enzyme n=1 Tax=Lichenifustis flavocetrariae TaxID=2949735 RepID=A0AA41YVM6_9HYPH|nr:aminotransferase class I/II-fold pyridoxal phosphate-dependent enzyme [Lichenifustis flavocetrariae]MCW6508934.1 aminotransferase class I/II-fold pyridoxal phosphate-dependent enzyme [Lichenifustis flavocetrariae]
MTIDPAERARLIVAHDGAHAFDAVVPPIVQTSLFTFPSMADMVETYAGRKSRPVYSRVGNPTVSAFEEKMAALEQTDDAIGFPSGMAAISGAILAFIKPGDRIVCVRHVYPDAYRLFEGLLKGWDVSTVYVDGGDPDAIAAVLPGAKLLYLESPNSWMMEAHDVGTLAALARRHGVMTMIDNSWATPVFQQPATLGVDLVIHSASKYIGGHSDVVAGVVAGRHELVDHIRRTICPYIGAKLAPFEAWLLLRGLRTLPERVRAHEASALTLARHLVAHPLVTAVHHPGLANRLPPGLLGTTGLFSFEAHESLDIPVFCDALKLFKIGVSWGGHESLVVPALVTRVQAAGPNSAVDFGVPERMVRLHVGLEGTNALWSDLTAAFETAKR